MPYLTGQRREVAEWLDHEMSRGKPLTVAATDAGLSRTTARRLVFALTLTEDVEAGDWDDEWSPGVDALFFGAVHLLTDDASTTETDEEDAA